MAIETPARRGLKIARIVFYLLIIGITGLILFQHFWGGDGEPVFGNLLPSSSKEVRVKYVPKDFQFQIDEDEALAIISNPQRNRKEFNELIREFNLAMLYHVADRMSLPDSIRQQIPEKYEEQHPYLRQMYYNDFMALRDTTSELYNTWYKSDATDAVAIMKEVASKYTCYLINQVIVSLMELNGATFTAKGRDVASPCGIALTEALNPVMDRLRDRAAIRDFQQSKGLMQERVENVIAELSTMEVRDKKGLSRQMKTKVLGYNVSSTDVEISAISILKVGFRLDQFFRIDLDDRKRAVIITLPEPEILSHEVYPQIDNLSIGWLREIKDEDFNENFNLLRKEFRRDAINSQIMDKARDQASELMQTMFSPVVTHFNKQYKVSVRFRNDATFEERGQEEILLGPVE